MTLDLEGARNVAIILGTIVAALTLIKAVAEYTRQNAQKRAEHYARLREQFHRTDRFTGLFDLIGEDDPKLSEIPFHIKQDFLGFYEDIAIMMNSGLLKKPVAHYMFSFYALRCWESKHFWTTMNRESEYWSLFQYFVTQMAAFEKNLVGKRTAVERFRI